jgi:hypothetical protein
MELIVPSLTRLILDTDALVCFFIIIFIVFKGLGDFSVLV